MTRDLPYTPYRPPAEDAALGAVLGRCGQRLSAASHRLLVGGVDRAVAAELAAEVVADVARALAREVAR